MGERGVAVKQCYAVAEVGVIAYETDAMDGMVVSENIIVEIVRPGTGDPVGEGEVGEVVVTSFNPDYPMIRLATGDMSAVLAGQSPCGRTNTRIKGWMGRADQTAKVKGMFVRPEQVAEVMKRHPEIARVRLAVTRENEQDAMTLHVECAGADAGLEAQDCRDAAVGDQAEGCGETGRAGQPAERRQGDRGRTAGGVNRARNAVIVIEPSPLVGEGNSDCQQVRSGEGRPLRFPPARGEGRTAIIGLDGC